ncbi:MGMT family protein [Candidatus Woesearchaeota archaeon]|nr:MGMT family protein [Candidatus Woesearchaeota archaeon]
MKSFSEKVYELCKRVPKGKVVTYKDIALFLGINGYRAVGQVLRCNPYAPKVPCHRVIRSDGNVGGFKGEIRGKLVQEKIKMLSKEGITIEKGKVDLAKYKFQFN